MFACPHGLDDFFLMDIRRSADINDIDLRIIEQVIIIGGTLFETVQFNCLVDLLPSAGHNSLQPAGNIGTFIAECMQFQGTACANDTYCYSVFHVLLSFLLTDRTGTSAVP